MSDLHDIRCVETFADLNEALFEKPKHYKEDLFRHRAPFVYRGMPKDFPLSTSLMRPNMYYIDYNLEGNLLKTFKLYGREKLVEQPTDLHWLTLAQHYGLPTRLLDWTYSTYVALHFATDKYEHRDEWGVVWAVNFVDAKQTIPDEFKAILIDNNSGLFSLDSLATKFKTLNDLYEYAQLNEKYQLNEFPLFFEPPSFDERVVNQFAVLSMFTNPHTYFDCWLQNHPDLYRKILISPKLKNEIRNKLDIMNISERVMFPGLDGLSTYLKRYYGPEWIGSNDKTCEDVKKPDMKHCLEINTEERKR